MNKHWLINSSFFLALFFVGCSDDNYRYPNMEQDLVELKTGHDGVARIMLCDSGDTLQLANPVYGLDKDTVYRYIVNYVRQPEEETPAATIYNKSLILSIVPSSKLALVTDPVSVISVWRGLEYVNFRLNVLTQKKSHYYGLKEEGIIFNADGTRLLQLILYHDKNNDVEAYTRTVLLSCPLYRYKNVLRKGDSIAVSIETYTGRSVYKLPY